MGRRGQYAVGKKQVKNYLKILAMHKSMGLDVMWLRVPQREVGDTFSMGVYLEWLIGIVKCLVVKACGTWCWNLLYISAPCVVHSSILSWGEVASD